MFMKRFTRPFRQLQGKLTLSYTSTSVVTFLLVEVIALVVVFSYIGLNISSIVVNNLKLRRLSLTLYRVYPTARR
jgi:hypothetical protein